MKKLFTPISIFSLRPCASLFTVEVGTSDIGDSGDLSQRNPSDEKPADRNYNVENCELLELVLALQEWRHSLERSAQPFVVQTDNKNFAYLQSARHLN